MTAATLTCQTLLTEMPEFFLRCIGEPATKIARISSPDDAKDGSAVFCATPKALADALRSPASVLVISAKVAPDLEAKRDGKTLLVANNVERAMASAIHRWFLQTPYTDSSIKGVHPTAVVDATAKLGSGVRIGPHAYIAAGVNLGNNVYVGANAVVEANVSIGDASVIHPLAYIGHSTQIGARCEVLPQATVGKEGYGYAHDEKNNHYRVPHQGRVVLEDDVHIGASTCIDRATFGETRIGAGTKIDNQVHIAHNCKIGRNGLLTARFAMAGSSQIGNNFVTGGNTQITGHVKICDQVQLSGNSGVTKDITEPGQYGGFPLMPLRAYLKNRAAMAHLTEMRKQLSELATKVLGTSATDTEE